VTIFFRVTLRGVVDTLRRSEEPIPTSVWVVGEQTFYGKGLHRLLWADFWAETKKITTNDVTK